MNAVRPRPIFGLPFAHCRVAWAGTPDRASGCVRAPHAAPPAGAAGARQRAPQNRENPSSWAASGPMRGLSGKSIRVARRQKGNGGRRRWRSSGAGPPTCPLQRAAPCGVADGLRAARGDTAVAPGELSQRPAESDARRCLSRASLRTAAAAGSRSRVGLCSLPSSLPLRPLAGCSMPVGNFSPRCRRRHPSCSPCGSAVCFHGGMWLRSISVSRLRGLARPFFSAALVRTARRTRLR